MDDSDYSYDSDGLDSADEAAAYSAIHHAPSKGPSQVPTPARPSTAPPAMLTRESKADEPLFVPELSDDDDPEPADDDTLQLNVSQAEDVDHDDGDWAVDEGLEGAAFVAKHARGRFFAVEDMSSIRCYNCNTNGHLARDCDRPRVNRGCHLCGRTDHQRYHCPDDLCFNCGFPGHRINACDMPRAHRASECHRCHMHGHYTFQCTDLWRQYANVTQDSQLGPSRSRPPLKPNDALFCSNCGAGGHLNHECPKDRWSEIPARSLLVARFDRDQKTFLSLASARANQDNSSVRQSQPSSSGFVRNKRSASNWERNPDNKRSKLLGNGGSLRIVSSVSNGKRTVVESDKSDKTDSKQRKGRKSKRQKPEKAFEKKRRKDDKKMKKKEKKAARKARQNGHSFMGGGFAKSK
eukprot:TRINITY_DN9786_c0_g1_i1.p1 TRINITY_DN9786_c0_g1~~TRINITY_DN9786_c0_g1_i1.p1  ORF type:complete len:408 (+),score=88.70 TRINITY_DN9786_c0_g1_i1:168-1391(+)